MEKKKRNFILELLGFLGFGVACYEIGKERGKRKERKNSNVEETSNIEDELELTI